MKKKIALIVASLLCTSSFAAISTTVQVPAMTNAAQNQTFWIFATHSYVAANDTGIAQNVAICYTTALCQEAKWPGYHKVLHSCDTFTLKPGEVKTDTKSTKLEFNYPFNGYCDVEVSTESFGWYHSLAIGKGKLHVG